MSTTLRVSVCSNCGHLLVRAASCRGNPTRNRTLPVWYSKREISWGSLFDFKSKGTEKRGSGSQGKGSSSAEESRKRAEAIAREVRLRRDQIGRPAPPPTTTNASASTNSGFTSTRSAVKTGTEGVKREAPGEILREALHGTIRQPPPSSTPSSLFSPNRTPPLPPPRYPPALRTVAKSDSVLSKKGNPFLSPLKAEQKEAMRKYLELATKDQASRKRKLYPWEETPSAATPWDKEGNDKWASIRRLLSLRAITVRPPAPSRIYKALAPPPRGTSRKTGILEVKGEAGMGESRLFSHLRDLHVRSLVGYTGQGSEEAEKANLELRQRIVGVIRDAKRSHREYISSSSSEFERNMSEVFLTGTERMDGVSVTTLVKYVLAREGYDPALLEVVQKAGEGVYDEFGGIKLKVLTGINDERFRMQMAQLSLTKGLISHVVKRTQSQNNDPLPQAGDTPTIFSVITHQTCLPISEHAFERNSIILSPTTGTILFKSKEQIELYTTDRQRKIALKEVGKGRLVNELEGMGKEYTKWRKTLKVITGLYDF